MAIAVKPEVDHAVPHADDHKDDTPPGETQEIQAQGIHRPIEHIKVIDIQIPPTVRADWEHLDVLQASLQTTGLLHPITVRQQGDIYELLSGHNRLQAAKNLGWTTIAARILEFDDHNALRQELVILDENLCRDELNHLEYAEALGRQKQIYQRLYPRTGHGKGRTQQDPENGSHPPEPPRPAFLDDKARQLGWSRSKLGEYLYISKRLLPEVREMIRGHAMVNHFTQLSDLAHEEPAVQLAVARLLQREPQMVYESAFAQACPQRAREKGIAAWDHLSTDPTKPPAETEPLAPEDTSSAAPDSDKVPKQDKKVHEGTKAQPSPSSHVPSAVHKPETQEDYIDPIQKRIDEAEKLHKEFNEISHMVRARQAYTLDHVLWFINNYCERFVGQQYIRRDHHTMTITFEPFPTPEALQEPLPDGCPGWRLYSRH